MNMPRFRLDRRTVFRLLAGAAILAGVAIAVLWRDDIDAVALQAWVAGFGPWAPAVFVCAYAVATVFFVPGLLFTLAAGALFGPWLGTLFGLLGATAGAAIAFLAARHLFGEWIVRRAPARARRVVEGVEAEGWRFVAMTRLIPFIPFNALNYALGLTRIGIVPYVVASFLFMAPGGAAYAYLGYAGRELATGGEDLVEKGLLGLAALGLAAFLPRLIRHWRARRAASPPGGGFDAMVGTGGRGRPPGRDGRSG